MRQDTWRRYVFFVFKEFRLQHIQQKGELKSLRVSKRTDFFDADLRPKRRAAADSILSFCPILVHHVRPSRRAQPTCSIGHGGPMDPMPSEFNLSLIPSFPNRLNPSPEHQTRPGRAKPVHDGWIHVDRPRTHPGLPEHCHGTPDVRKLGETWPRRGRDVAVTWP